ncbi:MAG: competence/damage-inducible protein A, partial [Flavobacteriales bacterium]
QTIDKNAAWLSEQLNSIGITVYQQRTIGDHKLQMFESLDNAFMNSDIVIMTGGLGPTKDDFTKNAITEYFGLELKTNEEILHSVKNYLHQKGRQLTEVNKKQAEVPAGSITFENKMGTAPGIWIEQEEKILIALPGVPYEMRDLMRYSG